MKKKTVVLLGGGLLIIFLFVPFIQTISQPLEGPESTAWVSPSFMLFQCGVAVGRYPIQVPNGGTSGVPEPFWARNPVWNCEFPHP